MGIRGPWKSCAMNLKIASRQKQQWRLWYVELQTLPVIFRLNFVHPIETSEAQSREHLHKIEGLAGICMCWLWRYVLQLQTFVPFLFFSMFCKADGEYIIFRLPVSFDHKFKLSNLRFCGFSSSERRVHALQRETGNIYSEKSRTNNGPGGRSEGFRGFWASFILFSDCRWLMYAELDSGTTKV